MTIDVKNCPYEAEIKAAMTAYLPMWDWRWGMAQIYQESLYDPLAKSGVGAMGIAQFMPDTWMEVCDDLGYPDDASAFNPHAAIVAYAYYMAKLRKVWSHVDRSEDDRRRLTQASYNCGTGNMLRAQRLAGGSHEYIAIIAALPQVTGQANAHQTRDYVEKCQKWYNALIKETT